MPTWGYSDYSGPAIGYDKLSIRRRARKYRKMCKRLERKRLSSPAASKPQDAGKGE